MKYEIITNEALLKDFIDWLPALDKDEKYFVSLFARKKYAPDSILSSDKTQLKRFTSDKDRLFDKICQLEAPLGSYKLRNQPIPPESLVIYINPNPRSLIKATHMLMRTCTNLIEYGGNMNIHSQALSAIQKSKSKSHFCDFDIDTKDIDLSLIEDILPKYAYHILETRGGYHLLVDVRKAPKTKWHPQIREIFNIDQIGDQLIPIPGCIQGGFTPKFLIQ